MDPATIQMIMMAIQAAASLGGGIMKGMSSNETPIQGKQRETIDQIIASMQGDGPYSQLFNMDPEAFQKSFVDPAKSMFSNQIAPQIQQQYIAGGQQKGTGLEDQLLRAGVDMDQLLNQQYMDYLNQGQNRMTNMLGGVLSTGGGAQSPMGFGQAFGESLSGLASSDNFWKNAMNIGRKPEQYREGYAA